MTIKQHDDLAGNLDALEDIIKIHVADDHPSRAYALMIIKESKKIVSDLKRHAEWHDEMDKGRGSVFD